MTSSIIYLSSHVIPVVRQSAAIALTGYVVKEVVDRALQHLNPMYRMYLTIVCSVVVITKMDYVTKLAFGAPGVKAADEIEGMVKEQPVATAPLQALNRELFGYLTAGKETKFLKTKGWDFAFLIWVMSQNQESFAGYTLFRCDDSTKIKERLRDFPKSVIFTNLPLDAGLEIPPQSYVVRYCTKSATDVRNLPTLQQKTVVDALESWIRSQKRSVYFYDNCLASFYSMAQETKGKSAYAWIKIVTSVSPSTQFSIKPNIIVPGSFIVARRDGNVTLQTMKELVKALRQSGLEIVFDVRANFGMPSFLSYLQKTILTEVHGKQIDQIKAALSGGDSSRAVVIGANRVEVEALLGSDQFEPYGLKLDTRSLLDQNEFQHLLDYLKSSPKAVLYIPELGCWPPSHFTNLSTALAGKNSIVVQITHKELHAMDEKSMFFETYKKVLLTPFNSLECFRAVNKWVLEKQVEVEPRVLQIAVEMAFLLFQENGSELSFTKDLIERALLKSSPNAQDIWEVFKTMHREYSKELEEKKLKCASLSSISIALKKKFNMVFPVKKVQLSEPPFYLKDLNEEMKDSSHDIVSIQSRLDALEDALLGQYKNALIIGESGVGKTTLVKQVARLSAHKKLEEGHPLYGATIYVLNARAFMREAQWVGTFEARVDELFNFLGQSENSVLFIDEIHLVMGLGAYHGNEGGTVSQHMKTYLEESGICVMGATTHKEFSKWVENDDAFVRRFNQMRLKDPTDEEVTQIFKAYSKALNHIHPTLVFTEQNIDTVQAMALSNTSAISLVDRGKKLLEAVAKRARRAQLNEVSEEFIQEVAIALTAAL